MKHFLNLNMQKGVEIKPQKRQLLIYAAVEVEKCMVKKLTSSTLAVSKSVLQGSRFLSTYEGMATGLQILPNLAFSLIGEATSRYNNK